MNIATVLFTYNRSTHTSKVLDALSRNSVLPKKLYIFQDGLKKEAHRAEWEKVNDLIHNVGFCPTQLQILDRNIGVAQSVVSGINYVLESHDAVIVVEDDCMPAASFMTFMEQCLEKYEENKQVYSVSGYSWPIDIKKEQADIYGCGRTSSWGWGTWKDRWKEYSFDNGILKRLKNDDKKSRILATWGNDCERMLLKNVAGEIDAWDIYWTLHVFEKDGICINPYESLIKNIGLDGSGVHCGVNMQLRVELSQEVKSEFVLPDKIEMLRTTKEAFSDLYGSYTAVNEGITTKENVIIYGLGSFFKKYEKEINEKYYIRAFSDRKKRGWYAGKKIIALNEIIEYPFEKIIVMVQNIQQCFSISSELIDSGVAAEQIVLGHSLYGNYGEAIDRISVLADGGLLLTVGDSSICVNSKDEFDNVYRTFVKRLYNYSIHNGKKDIVIDIGRNTDDVVPYFLTMSSVEKVYEYELFEHSLLKARDVKEMEPKKASEVVKAIFEQYPDHNLILKLDCAEPEYDIVCDFFTNGVLDKSAIIMIQCHREENAMIMEKVEEAGFSQRLIDTDGKRQLFYAYR